MKTVRLLSGTMFLVVVVNAAPMLVRSTVGQAKDLLTEAEADEMLKRWEYPGAQRNHLSRGKVSGWSRCEGTYFAKDDFEVAWAFYCGKVPHSSQKPTTPDGFAAGGGAMEDGEYVFARSPVAESAIAVLLVRKGKQTVCIRLSRHSEHKATCITVLVHEGEPGRPTPKRAKPF